MSFMRSFIRFASADVSPSVSIELRFTCCHISSVIYAGSWGSAAHKSAQLTNKLKLSAIDSFCLEDGALAQGRSFHDPL